ncbi:MAG TPA: diphosphomevalonate decarboxylase [Candidatus Woesebacteria bacterium]|nr:diphosphomevalonate decarboxylase [Candidatus Woesebacteria bacterium]
MKATAIAHPNVAFIKYWGRKDETLRLPTNGSLSMNLSEMNTTTTVEFSESFTQDIILIDGQQIVQESQRVIEHIDRIRKLANISSKAKIVSQNNFPSGTGLSSSSSAFAALTVASAKAAGLSLKEKELSILARQGSGSACRSIPNGFVEWKDAEISEESYAISLFPSDYWDIVDIVTVVSTEKKLIPTTCGQLTAYTSPFFETRLTYMQEKLQLAKQYMQEKNFSRFGELIEAEALEMHAVMISQKPSLIYWSEGTLQLMKFVQQWRIEGLPVYFTINTGQDIHLICQSQYIKQLKHKLEQISKVKQILINKPAEGTKLINTHLF